MLSIFPSRRPEVAIDFGTANLRVIRRDEGIVFDEPSLCCFGDLATSPSVMAAGSAAQAMLDRAPGRLEVRRALARGVLRDIDTATELLRYAIPRALRRRQMGAGPSVVIGVPADATHAERAAMLTTVQDAGIRAVRLVPEPLAAAMGAELPVQLPRGSMLVECGAGTTEVAVISLGDICVSRSVRIGGDTLDQAIADHLHFQRKFLVGDLTAERIKQEYGERRTAGSADEALIEVRGRSLMSQMPAELRVPLVELDKVVEKHVAHIVDAVRDALNDTPPELSQDIHTHGITLTGGSAVTPRLREMIEEGTGLKVVVADHPAHCVARGLHRLLQSPA